MTLRVDLGTVFGLARRADGSIVVLGSYRGTISIAGKTLTSEPTGDAFLAILSADLGSWLRAETLRTTGSESNPGRVAVSPIDDSIAVALNFTGTATVRGRQFTSVGSYDTLLFVLP